MLRLAVSDTREPMKGIHMADKVYLGDSVYAEFNTAVKGDVTLTTENGYGPTNTIYLEPEVIDALNKLRENAGNQ